MAGAAMTAAGCPPQSHKYYPDVKRVCGKIHSTVHYPESGSYMTWVTDGLSATDFDSDKENKIPTFLPFPNQPPSRPPTDITDRSTTEPSSLHTSTLRVENSWEI